MDFFHSGTYCTLDNENRKLTFTVCANKSFGARTFVTTIIFGAEAFVFARVVWMAK